MYLVIGLHKEINMAIKTSAVQFECNDDLGNAKCPVVLNRKNKMKIYYQYSKCTELTPTKGDFINEINTMKALSLFAEVYYAGNFFDAHSGKYDTSKNITVNDADFVWIRASEKILIQALLHNKPCCWMASPYNKFAFDKASFIACFSETWALNLTNGVCNHLNPEGIKWDDAINVGQTLDDCFVPQAKHKLSIKIRKEISGYPVIGCFGRIVKSNFPHLLISSMPMLQKKYPKIKFLFGCTNQGVIPDIPGIIYTNYQHSDMPYALSACDAVFTGAQGVEWDFCGSLKLIEAAACGVPFICAESKARAEFATEKYPGFLPMSAFMLPITLDKKKLFVETVSNMIEKKLGEQSVITENARNMYSIKNQAEKLKKIISMYL